MRSSRIQKKLKDKKEHMAKPKKSITINESVGETELTPYYYKDYLPPILGVIKWQMFVKFIFELSRYELRIDDIAMYLPATVSVIDNVLHNKSNPQLALHTILAFVHNMRGHRFLPYIDPKIGYHCNLSPLEDVVYHALMLGFVDYAVNNKFPSKTLNTVYKQLSRLMKLGIAYSLYVSYNVASDPEACQNFVPSLATSSVPAGTMFSLLAMWNFPFDYPDKYNKSQLLAYSSVMYLVSIASASVLVYEYLNGSKFEDLSAGKFFESYFIAGSSLKGLEIISNFLWEKSSQLISLIRDESFAGFIEHYTGGVRNFFSIAANQAGDLMMRDVHRSSSEHKINSTNRNKVKSDIGLLTQSMQSGILKSTSGKKQPEDSIKKKSPCDAITRRCVIL